MFVARKSENINDDIRRNWSSWNFGQEGFEGTRSELDGYLSESTDESPVWISGFEIYPDQMKQFIFGELYPGYWVAIDRVNASNGLSAIKLGSTSFEEAIKEANARTDYFGDGISFDASTAKLVYSSSDIHVFEIED